MIYDINGNLLDSAYDIDSERLRYAYDKSGTVIYEDGGIVPVKVMTYNVGQWYIGDGSVVPAAKESEYRNLIDTMLSQNDPDILIMCEYDTTFSDSGTTAEAVLSEFFPYINAHEYGGKNGLGVASKFPISNYERHMFTNSGSTWHSYDSFTVTVGSMPITVIATHLTYATESYRLAENEQLLSYVAGLDSFILAGDFNTTHCDSESTSDFTNMIKPYIDAGYNVANCNNTHGFHITFRNTHDDSGYVGRLDNIITSSDLPIESVYVDNTKVTDTILDEPLDHLPLIAVLSLS